MGVTMRPVPLPEALVTLREAPVPLREAPEGSMPEPAGAVVTVNAGLVATIVGRVMGTTVVPDDPGLGPKVVPGGCGSGSGRMVTSLVIMLLTSSPTLTT